MPQSPDWKQFLEAGMQFTAMTRAQAQRRARELVREGQLAQERMQSFVEELLETSRKRADEFVEIVRHEVNRQLRAVGISTGSVRTSPAKKKSAGKKTATAKKKSSAKKKAPAKKKSAGKKTATVEEEGQRQEEGIAREGSSNSAAKQSP